MFNWVQQPWPWYVAGPMLGLFVPILLIAGNKVLGVSNNLRHTCAAWIPGDIHYFKYDWKNHGLWNLCFALGIVAGGFITVHFLSNHKPVAISAQTVTDLKALGIKNFSGLVPGDLFSWSSLLSIKGFILIVGGGFFIGFGTAYAGGCTSGHGLSGIGDLQLPSLIALISFFVGGILATFLLFPLIFK